MAIRKRNGYWHYRFELQGAEYTGNTGLEGTEQNRKSALQVAARKLQEARAELCRQSQPLALDFAAAAGVFIAWARDVKYRNKRSTWQRIKVSFASLVEFFGAFAVSAIDAGAIDRYKYWRIADHGVRDVTLRHDLHALSLFFQHGIKQGWCAKNVVREVEIPGDAGAVRTNVLTDEQEKRYFAAAKKLKDKSARANLYDLGRLMINQGMRPDEILSAPRSAVDLQAKTLQVNAGKTRAARREVYLTEESCRVLKARMKGDGEWLFPSDRHPKRHIIKLAKTHDRACNLSKTAFVLYDLRHTYATRMAALGVDAITLASMLGHANLRSIMRYVHPQSEEKRRVQERYEAAQLRRGLKVVVGE